MGVKIPLAAKDSWADFVRNRGTKFTARYEWIKDARFYTWVHANLDTLDIMDGTESFGVFIYDK